MSQPDMSAPPGEERPGALAEVAGRAAAGKASAEELHEAFLSATVFCEAGDKPGFQALGESGNGLIPVFSSDAQLARYALQAERPAMAWFSTTGADLLGLMPDGYDIALDIAGDSPLRLRPAALQASTRVEVSWSK